ncbi:hypothetical protein CCAX7_50580 [Capsulimonas corticalis]|uniref:Uncharacterized protein n=1 Tax=Capsulimonas corticalis TaxID=2219043 RepID=A0A402CPK9_9BACT|nr:hypothetical protein [Capsulimonas corticalis]BDI33007.1 hypothetical protein CCAX7_50580 [Capsulimonas corticalis]
MRNTTITRRLRAAAILSASIALAVPAFVATPAQAGVLHKHPTAAGVGAGLVAHHMAKKSAAKGGHSLAARHPIATGVVAGVAAHHMLKKK